MKPTLMSLVFGDPRRRQHRNTLQIEDSLPPKTGTRRMELLSLIDAFPGAFRG